jgi:elongation factor Ts
LTKRRLREPAFFSYGAAPREREKMATMAITADMVKKLREQTGAGMMDCKAALAEANGNFDEATTVLRKKGLAMAAKKAGRSTNEGLIGHRLSSDRSTGTLVEVNCESDFVARTDDFTQLIEDVLTEIEKAGDGASQAWLENPDGPVRKRVAATIGRLGENMAVPRFVRYAGKGYVGQYIHMGGKLGVQVEFAGVTPAVSAREEFGTLVKEIAMQIAAASPAYVSRDGVPADVLEKERAIYRAQMENSGKPANVLDKIVEGKLGSYYSQVVLPDQPSIRDPKMSVKQVLEAAAKALGATVTVTRFARLKVGEGTESAS